MPLATKELSLKPALQQPAWEDEDHIAEVREELSGFPALVGADEVRTLRELLVTVAQGRANIVQAGDCAEDLAESTAGHVARKVGMLSMLAGTMRMTNHKPVLRVGRIAGQYSKPRSNPVETVDGVELPVFRGQMVNGQAPNASDRRPDPTRLLSGYWAANRVLHHLGWRRPSSIAIIEPPVWTSHEALLLDYELPALRRDAEGSLVLTSTHWPWVGDRTRDVDGPHISLLSRISNPVACKVGPSMTVDELLELAERLDPERTPGRLTFISRMGAKNIADKLGLLVEAVAEAGHPVIWLCDPMHGNTTTAPNGLKTRYLVNVLAEVRAFRAIVAEHGGVAGGLHLEATPEDALECVLDGEAAAGSEFGEKYRSLCDPRLNLAQALEVVRAW
ncbi:MAG: 3-deoxy-7-phosphoheptulonate synthase [Segniliparus sp.]|uniref:3-deoxy-7-phosphoheptulonate synthase n=1 Tax=Segniliparus sp. TaxID=2804064 RepID=UPI003F3F5E9B